MILPSTALTYLVLCYQLPVMSSSLYQVVYRTVQYWYSYCTWCAQLVQYSTSKGLYKYLLLVVAALYLFLL